MKNIIYTILTACIVASCADVPEEYSDTNTTEKLSSTNGSGTSRSVSGFIVKAGDKKFREGDMLKAAGWAAPARNFARGNILDGTGLNNARWTGIG